jgi:hypothetical protein
MEPYYARPVGTGFTFRFREWLRRSDEGLKNTQADPAAKRRPVKVAKLSGSECPVGPWR